MKKKYTPWARLLAIITITCMIFVIVPPQEASAASITNKSYVKTMTLENGAGDNVTITKTAPFELNVSCTHSLSYSRMDIRVYKYGTNTLASGLPNNPLYISKGMNAGGSWEVDFNCMLAPGTYKLVIYKTDSKGDYKPFVDRVTIKLTDKGVFLASYKNIISQNKKIRNSGSAAVYMNKGLLDFKYMLFKYSGKSSNRAVKSSTESKYYKSISSKIVKSSDSKYTKLKKIYKYTAEKLYYDNYKSKAYDDPYYNLKHINKSGASKGYNWSKGRVAVNCDGYAGLFIALARSQNIPARMVGGNLLSSAKETWENQKSVKSVSHCWVQAYVNGKWIDIDPCRASLNKRNKDGSWTKASQISYMFFDMNHEVMAQTHCSVKYMGDAASLLKSQTIYINGSSKTTKITKKYGCKSFSLKASAKTSLKYKSSKTSVATVSSTGKVTIKKPGTTKITITAPASSKYKAASKTVTIYIKK